MNYSITNPHWEEIEQVDFRTGKLARLASDPRLRWHDVPYGQTPDMAAAHSLYQEHVRRQMALALHQTATDQGLLTVGKVLPLLPQISSDERVIDALKEYRQECENALYPIDTFRDMVRQIIIGQAVRQLSLYAYFHLIEQIMNDLHSWEYPIGEEEQDAALEMELSPHVFRRMPLIPDIPPSSMEHATPLSSQEQPVSASSTATKTALPTPRTVRSGMTFPELTSLFE